MLVVVSAGGVMVGSGSASLDGVVVVVLCRCGDGNVSFGGVVVVVSASVVWWW